MRGEMTVAQAGALGGRKVLEQYGHKHFVTAGRLGGEARYSAAGSAGMSAMGRRGGVVMAATHDHDYYARIGKLGAAARARNIQARKEVQSPN